MNPVRKAICIILSLLFSFTTRLPSGVAVADAAAANSVVLFEQPTIDSETQFADYLATTQLFDGFKLRWPYANPAKIDWDAGAYTGIQVPSQYQRAANGTTGSTAFQGYLNTVGLWFNTASDFFLGDLIPMTMCYDFPAADVTKPFATPNRELSYSFEMKIPTAERKGHAEVYACAYFMFQHETTGNTFWFGTSMFDLRGRFPESVIVDDWAGGTKLAIAGTAMADGMEFSHRGPDSSLFQSAAWNDWKYFDFRVSEDEFQNVIDAAAAEHAAFAGTRAEEYRLVHINMNPEAYTPKHSYVLLRAANQSGVDQTLQVFFKTAASDYWSEDKSVKIPFKANGGAFQDLEVDFSTKPLYKGRITGLRVDPFSDNGNFAIDSIHVADRERRYVQKWDFNGSFQGWNPVNMANARSDGTSLLATGINGDPYMTVATSFEVTYAPDLGVNSEAKLGAAVRNIKIAITDPAQATGGTAYNRIIVRGANGSGSDQSLQVFFKTAASNYYSEDKSMPVKFPGGGGTWHVEANFADHPLYTGTITGVRVDPFASNGNFAIDSVYIANAKNEYVKQWDFKSQTRMTNPFFGWILYNITEAWTNGEQWGGRGVSGDPYFAIDVDFAVDPGSTPAPAPAPAPAATVYDKVHVKAANGTGVDRTLQVFFQTESSRFFSEDKSAKAILPKGGGYVEVVVDLSQAQDSNKQQTYKGNIVALRVDPIDAGGSFGVEYVYVMDASRNYIYKADFNGQSVFANPFVGWRMNNIANGWTNGAQWGGLGINDPYFDTNVNFSSGR